jgi:hypothetical protein
VVSHPAFREGATHTGFLDIYHDDIVAAPASAEQETLLSVAAAMVHPDFDFRYETPEPLATIGGWRV